MLHNRSVLLSICQPLNDLCLVAQLCPTLCDPMDCSLPGSSVHGDFPGKNTGVVANVNEYRLVLPILKVLGDLNFVV